MKARRASSVSSAIGLVLACALAVGVGGRARAAEKSEEDSLIEQGVDRRHKGQDEEALGLFERAYRIAKSSRASAQMALAEQALGHWVDAEAHLLRALGDEGDPWVARNKKVLTQSLADIQRHLGSLEVTGAVPGAEVLLDGKAAGTMPLASPLRATAGTVALEVRAPGYLPVVRSVIVSAGASARESIVLVPVTDTRVASPPPAPARAAPAVTVEASRPAPAPAPAAPQESSARHTVGAVLTAAGGAALVSGVVFNLVRENRARTFNTDQCTTADPVNYGGAGCKDRYDAVQSAGTLMIVGYVAGAVLAGAGLYLALTNPGDAGAQASNGHAGFALRCAPGLDLGVTCAARF
jgi:hypothetical protein